MKVLRKLPGQPVELIEVPNELKALQHQVCGYIETVGYGKDAVIICNEEGRFMGLPRNVYIGGVSFVGPILICGVDGEEFADVPTHVVREMLS